MVTPKVIQQVKTCHFKTLQHQLPHKCQSSSSSSSYTDPDSESEATSSSICTADTESLSSQSTASTCSNRQLRPRLPICYNETFLVRLQGRPQVTVMPTLSTPLPLSSSEEEDNGHHRTTVKMSLLHNCCIHL